jgi:outer membrane protein insertion porin family
MKPNADFQFKNLLSQLAIGTGFGIRLDFDYFVIRYDIGMPVKVNYDNDRSQWVIQDWAFGNADWLRNNLRHNVGVGYPF